MLLDLAIKATVLLGAGVLCAAGLRRASAATRHAMWIAVFAALLLLPVARLVMPEWAVIVVPDALTASQPPVPSSVSAATAVTGTGIVEAGAPRGWTSGWRWDSLALLVWMAGLIGQVGWIMAGHLGIRRLERECRPVSHARILARASRVAQWLGVRRPVRYLAVSNHAMPVTWGVFAPRVLLPDIAREWSDDQLDAVLVHELSHVERGDMVSHLAARAATALWWWHPLMWVAARRARFERERACDDLVLAMGTRASDYAENLVSFVSSLRSPVAPPATLAMARRSQLEGRVMAILKSDVNRRGVSQAGILVAMLMMVLVWPLAAARPEVPRAEPAPVFQEPVRIGGSVKTPRKIKNVAPLYPASAQADGRQGVVIMEVVIGTDGLVTQSKVIRSIGEDLDLAATDAVSQWEFEPTLLDGVAVPVIMTVTVNFTLADVSAPPPPPPAPTGLPGVADAPPPPPSAPLPTWKEGDDPLRIGGAIKAPTKIKNVDPIYPADAQDQRIQGVVILEVRIDKEGRIADAKVIRSVPLLDDAAMDAVLQWEFEPTLLNGQPIPVLMTVTVNFTLR